MLTIFNGTLDKASEETEIRKSSRKAQGEDLDGSCLGGVAVFLYVKALGLLQVGCSVNKIKLYRFGGEIFLRCKKREYCPV